MQNRVHCILKANEFIRRGSRILKWGVNFCNNVIEPINIWGIRKKRKKGAQKKGGENSPISPPLDPCLFIENSICIILFKTWFTCLDKEIFPFIIWIIILLFYFLIMINIPYSKALKKTDFSFIWRFGTFSQKQQSENSPCKLTSPLSSQEVSRNRPFHGKCQFPAVLWCPLMK